jgi:DNA gyrase subunit A
LKPVQRRILYTMHNELRLRSDAQAPQERGRGGRRDGQVPPARRQLDLRRHGAHGADFSMRMPLVDGAATSARPTATRPPPCATRRRAAAPLANELLDELGRSTVGFRPNYDGTRFEPEVLPARFPNLLVNGSQGIAVGMATSIPPHNLGEVVKAWSRMIDDPSSRPSLLKYVKGPDFPTGGQLLVSKPELADVYDHGQGAEAARRVEARGPQARQARTS